MRYAFLFFSVVITFGITGCSPKLASHVSNPLTTLTSDEPVAFLDVEHELPDDLIKVGSLRFQDSGFSTDCSFNSLLNKARIEARKNGANIVKVTDTKKPDLWSSCYRLQIDLYRYNGDVAKLKQYELKLD
ncbi:hypothetical protein DSM03_102527 [Leeuwenhoekiella aestuarii]|uniref:hypothetical protein n=1 Tax=Leeuwenhoekiella aestuarii TaxID=2249426 RepID=UPI000FFE6DAC|nr:hypothetical protein [Leeuwenhoekiella aestuarii]RXG17650.1 hypothetical protein DSM03_102527 [Leeuwenhoekiella aestuarii]